MRNPIFSKLAALGLALTLNGMMIGATAYLFNGQLQGPVPAASLVQTPGTATIGAI